LHDPTEAQPNKPGSHPHLSSKLLGVKTQLSEERNNTHVPRNPEKTRFLTETAKF
jgi:hypothetical protein